MKQGIPTNKTRRNKVYIGTVATLVLLGTGVAWAEMQGGKIELKQDTQAQNQTPAQTQTQPAPMDPFRDMLRLQQEVEQLFGNTLNPYSGFPEFESIWNQQQLQPAMDLSERPDAYIVQMELPGMDKSEITVNVKDHVLKVSAEHKGSTKKEDANEKVLVQERSLNSFSREVVLPKSVNENQVVAEYKNGILTITLPKTEKDQEVHNIEIK